VIIEAFFAVNNLTNAKKSKDTHTETGKYRTKYRRECDYAK